MDEIDPKLAAKQERMAKARAAREAKRAANRAAWAAKREAEKAERESPVAEPVEAAPIQDPDDPLTPEDRERIRQEAKRIVAEDSRKEAMAKLLEKEIEAIRGREGMRTGDPAKDEMVNIMIDTGLNADRITVNGKPYFHANQYRVPRHVAESLREIMFRSQRHEHDISGKPGIEFYRRARHTEIVRDGAGNVSVLNAPRPAA